LATTTLKIVKEYLNQNTSILVGHFGNFDSFGNFSTTADIKLITWKKEHSVDLPRLWRFSPRFAEFGDTIMESTQVALEILGIYEKIKRGNKARALFSDIMEEREVNGGNVADPQLISHLQSYVSFINQVNPTPNVRIFSKTGKVNGVALDNMLRQSVNVAKSCFSLNPVKFKPEILKYADVDAKLLEATKEVRLFQAKVKRNADPLEMKALLEGGKSDDIIGHIDWDNEIKRRQAAIDERARKRMEKRDSNQDSKFNFNNPNQNQNQNQNQTQETPVQIPSQFMPQDAPSFKFGAPRSKNFNPGFSQPQHNSNYTGNNNNPQTNDNNSESSIPNFMDPQQFPNPHVNFQKPKFVPNVNQGPFVNGSGFNPPNQTNINPQQPKFQQQPNYSNPGNQQPLRTQAPSLQNVVFEKPNLTRSPRVFRRSDAQGGRGQRQNLDNRNVGPNSTPFVPTYQQTAGKGKGLTNPNYQQPINPTGQQQYEPSAKVDPTFEILQDEMTQDEELNTWENSDSQ